MTKRNDRTGEKHGKLTVISESFSKKRIAWNCLCDCGNKTVVLSCNLGRNHTSSCGCIRNAGNNTKHNMTGTRIYRIWQGMKRRCYEKKHVYYKNYGGRGIEVCKSWLDMFENFYNDMWEDYRKHADVYGEKNTTIDRIDNNGNYTKYNCKWSTRKNQINNRR